MLEGGDEGQLHRFALLVARLRCGLDVLEPDPLVRIGLDPDRLHERLARGLVRVGRGAVVHRQHPFGAARDLVQRGVGGDRVQPRAQ